MVSIYNNGGAAGVSCAQPAVLHRGLGAGCPMAGLGAVIPRCLAWGWLLVLPLVPGGLERRAGVAPCWRQLTTITHQARALKPRFVPGHVLGVAGGTAAALSPSCGGCSAGGTPSSGGPAGTTHPIVPRGGGAGPGRAVPGEPRPSGGGCPACYRCGLGGCGLGGLSLIHI